MVTDRLANSHLYRALSPRIARAFDYVHATDFSTLTEGRHDVDGDRLFALVQRYTTRRKEDSRWEAHRRYIDLQYVVDGTELVGCVDLAQLTPEPHDADKDMTWLAGETGDWITLRAGHFMILWPDDAHMPALVTGAPAPVTKVVMKIAIA